MAKKNLEGHEQINLDSIAHLTIKDDELYWQGKKIRIAKRLELTWGEKVGGILIVIGTLMSPCATYFTGLENLCRLTGDRAPFCSIKAPAPSATKATISPSANAAPGKS